MNFGVCDFSRFAVTDWRLRRWRLCFLALMTATRTVIVEKAAGDLSTNKRSGAQAIAERETGHLKLSKRNDSLACGCMGMLLIPERTKSLNRGGSQRLEIGSLK